MRSGRNRGSSAQHHAGRHAGRWNALTASTTDLVARHTREHTTPRSVQTTTALDGSSCASRNLSRHWAICGPARRHGQRGRRSLGRRRGGWCRRRRSCSHLHRPPEPTAQQRGNGWCDQRPHDEGVEQQPQSDRATDLTNGSQVTGDHGDHGEREHQPAAVTTPPVPPMARISPVFSPLPISSLSRDTTSRL